MVSMYLTNCLQPRDGTSLCVRVFGGRVLTKAIGLSRSHPNHSKCFQNRVYEHQGHSMAGFAAIYSITWARLPTPLIKTRSLRLFVLLYRLQGRQLKGRTVYQDHFPTCTAPVTPPLPFLLPPCLSLHFFFFIFFI